MNEKNPLKKPHLKKPLIVTLILILVLFGGILIWNLVRAYFIKSFFANFQPPPATISTTQAITKNWQDYLPAIGVLKAVNSVDVSSESSGLVTHLFFESGQKVQAGTPLIQLDDKVEQEELKNYEADLEFSKVTNARLRTLIKSNAASQSELDQALAKFKQAQAQVEKTRALIEQKLIKAPFTGQLGIREVNLGQYVSAGNKLVSLESMDPLFLNFSLPEQYLKQLYLGQAVELSVDVYPESIFSGKVTAIDSKSNQNTHNILVQATVPNDKSMLYPGLFAKVKVMLPLQQNVVMVPQTAVTYSLYGDSIFVIVDKGKDKKGKPILEVTQRYVTTGTRFGNQIIIQKGIKAGEQVVTSGQIKLQNGSRVEINNTIAL